jgi:ribose-phosphate pyrophosphokinase
VTTIDLRRVKGFNFPDGQPHVALTDAVLAEALTTKYETEVVARITSSDDLMRLLMVKDILDRRGIDKIALRITYLMGARMDRPIEEAGTNHPFSLKVIAGLINGAGFRRVSIFDPHSDVATALLDARAIRPTKYVSLALSRADNPVVLIPDAGATKRTGDLLAGLHWPGDVVQALKHRDPITGELSGFEILDPDKVIDGRNVLIVDDLCDGGGTFAALGQIAVEKHYARSVSLYVSHGVLSKGPSIPFIDNIYTTDSYGSWDAGTYGRLIVDALP